MYQKVCCTCKLVVLPFYTGRFATTIFCATQHQIKKDVLERRVAHFTSHSRGEKYEKVTIYNYELCTENLLEFV